MYKALRDVHLATGLFAAVFLFAYATSAAQMAYPVYRLRPAESTSRVAVAAAVDATPRGLALWLMNERGMRGELTATGDGDGRITLTISRPGTTHRVEYDDTTRTAIVRTATQDAIGVLNRLHHTSGVEHGYMPANAWGWLLFAVSIALLVLAATGIAMWFQRHRQRQTGAVILAAGLAWGLTLLILIRFG